MALIDGMTIWILAVLLLAGGAGMGHRQGAIRVAFSFAGIVFSALLAWPLSGLIRPVLRHTGFHNPFLIQMVAPVVVFIILLAIFKSAGLMVHNKADFFYRYKAMDFQQILWERANRRLGLCLGLLNGLAYCVLLSIFIYNFSYWSVQVAPSGEESLSVRLLNRLGWDLQDTGLIRTARAIDPMPELYFQTGDVAGLIAQNPQLRDRLAAYPAFLSLAERDDFKQLGQNADFQGAWKSHAPLGKLWNDPQVQTMRQNTETADLVWNLVTTNLDDLPAYLQTGQSAKFGSQPIVGRWRFDVMASLLASVQTRVNVPSGDMAALRGLWSRAYAATELVAGADGQVFLNNLPQFKVLPNQPTTFDSVAWQGRWQGDAGNYDLKFAVSGANKSGTARINSSRLTVNTDSDVFVFERE